MEKTIKTIENFLLENGKKEFKLKDFIYPLIKVENRKRNAVIGVAIAKRIRLWVLKRQYSPVYIAYIDKKTKKAKPITDITKKSNFTVYLDLEKLEKIIKENKAEKLIFYCRSYDKENKTYKTFYAESTDFKKFKFTDKITKAKTVKKENKEKEIKEINKKVLEYKKMFE